MVKYWVSNTKFTGQVNTEGGGEATPNGEIITLTPPVWKRFQGQPFPALIRWLGKVGTGGVMVEVLGE
jgi:hypothetical protein